MLDGIIIHIGLYRPGGIYKRSGHLHPLLNWTDPVAVLFLDVVFKAVGKYKVTC